MKDEKPLRRFAMFNRDKPCNHPQGFPYRGEIPCTGPKVCPMCGTREEDAKPAEPKSYPSARNRAGWGGLL